MQLPGTTRDGCRTMCAAMGVVDKAMIAKLDKKIHRACLGGPWCLLNVHLRRGNCVPSTFQPSRDSSTGWHRRCRRNYTASQY